MCISPSLYYRYTRRNPLTVSIPCCLTFVHIRFRFRLQYTCVVVTLRSSPLSLNLYECVLCVPCGFDNTNPYLHISEPTCAVTTSSRASNTTDFLTSHATAVIATSSRSENMKPYSSEEGYPPTQQPPVTYRPPNSAPDSSPLPSYPPPNYAPSAGFHIPPGPYPPNPVPQDPYGRGHVPQSYPPPNLMPRPVVPNCPPGLEYLTQINQLLVKQKKELFEIITDIEVANRYVILNTMGQTVFNCNEESNFCSRQCCKGQRPYTMHVHDNSGMEVIRIKRPYKYACCGQCFSCVECCQDELTIEAPVGQVVGYVKQIQDGCNIRYVVKDASENVVLRIHGPSYCHCACFGEDVNFMIMSADGNTEVGRITKQWSNIIQEMFTDADNFGIAFPMDLDVWVKATLIGAVFLIDFMFFESNESQG
ncbi:hypothetical protein CRM22_004675 [Opisthorchis felineus]|uniref:Phospholipid scramblase n=1 Tax=Opisthorchis felineus TaxID=147828 RepID=A0A4S2M1P4_OPIFE|nr:hypothetical protein CRM22_004675 [Opisthorchis felineus]